ncbi:hypothetical protein T08_4424 [Trichinella sp. T8]|nr:hypothetical protein T08_4424 [Trichinella sp. T8]
MKCNSQHVSQLLFPQLLPNQKLIMNFEAGSDRCGLRLCIAMNYQRALNTSQRCLLRRLCYACMQIFFAPGGKAFLGICFRLE